MSGGSLSRKVLYGLRECVETIEEYNEGDSEILNDYSDETVRAIFEGVELFKRAAIYWNRIDYLFSGDDGEESFHRRLKDDLKQIGSNFIKLS